jgi:NAD(P)H-flavin reductase
VLAAFSRVEELHEITLQQLLYLSERGRVKVTFRFREDPRTAIKGGRNIQFAARSFEEILAAEIGSGREVSKVWVCGPPAMNLKISKFFKEQ